MRVFTVLFSCLILLCCCTRKSAQLPSNKVDQNSTQMDMMTYNKMCIEAENAEIQSFLDSSSVEYIKSDAGYWYKIVSKGTGAKVGHTVTISGTVEVLGGEACYELGVRNSCASESRGRTCSNYAERSQESPLGNEELGVNTLTLRLGKRDHTKVLDLALANAHVGDEIWIISPSSLAYGIKGISNCITSRTPVLYKIKVLNTNE